MRCVAPRELNERRDVAVALRFEKVMLATDQAAAVDATAFAGVVRERTYMGGFVRFAIATDFGSEITADLPISDAARRIDVSARVTASWSPADVTVLLE